MTAPVCIQEHNKARTSFFFKENIVWKEKPVKKKSMLIELNGITISLKGKWQIYFLNQNFIISNII